MRKSVYGLDIQTVYLKRVMLKFYTILVLFQLQFFLHI